MEITQQFNSEVMQAGWFNRRQTVIVAVSTGVDSMVLLTLMQQLPAQIRPKLVVAHVNHQLRSQSQVEAQFISEYCQQHHLQLEKTKWPVNEQPHQGVEAAARHFRYQFFAQCMAQHHAVVLLTAHHADDQAETVLMKLIRGGQLTQLQGILPEQPFEAGKLVRPLLLFSKAQIRAYAKEQQLTWYEDATNQNNDVLRNRIRHQVIPALKQESPAFLTHVKQYTAQLSATIQLAAQRTAELLQQVRINEHTYNVARWRQLTAIQQRAVLKAIFQAAQLPVTASYLDEATQLLNNEQKPTARLNLAHSRVFEKAYDQFSIKSELKVPQNHKLTDKIVVISNQWVQLPRGLRAQLVPTQKKSRADPWHMALDLQLDDLPLQVRQARPDDQIKLAGGGHKTVRRILIDHKIPPVKRAQQLVVVSAKAEVLWLIGLQRSTRELTETNYELVLKQSD